jgi:hypothetical protein
MPQYPLEAPPHPLRSPPPPHGAHTVQLLWPASSTNVSEAQALQLAALAGEKNPAGHGAHAVCPSRDWCCPAPHATQCSGDDDGSEPLTRPAAHAMHDVCATKGW